MIIEMRRNRVVQNCYGGEDMPAKSELLLSIVIINHNYGRFLREAIDSVFNQTRPAFEVIVVDDGSTDGSDKIIDSYGGRIRKIFKAAGGHVSAVNAGFAVSRGNIVIFLDADDYIDPTCVETVLKNWRPNASKLQYRLSTIDADGNDQKMTFPYFAKDLTPATVREQACKFGVYPWTVSSGNAFARSLLAQLLPINADEIYRSPDGYINKMAPLYGDVCSINDVLGAYRVHGKNAWAQKGGGLQLEPILRWLHFDIVLQRRFLAVAQANSIDVVSYGNQVSLQHVEHRVIARRFAPAATPYKQDSFLDTMRLGFKAAWVNPNVGKLGKLFWVLWLGMIVSFPKPLVVRLFGIFRGQSGRASISKKIVEASRGMARPGAPER
jgi:glycosyltransferase involved in cell wall biosynthesis